MSRYTYTTADQKYRIVLGLDHAHPLHGLNLGLPARSLFAEVWASGQIAHTVPPTVAMSLTISECGEAMQPYPQLCDEQARPEPETGDPIEWIGADAGDTEPLLDLQQLVAHLASYGAVPLDLQLRLLQDLDAVHPRALHDLSRDLAAICQQEPSARLPTPPLCENGMYILLNEQGWRVLTWESGEAKQPFEHILFPNEVAVLDIATSYCSDPGIAFAVHGQGVLKGLPIYAIFPRGAVLAGPVLISDGGWGLTPEQVCTVQEEVLRVPDTLRAQVSAIWYSSVKTISKRGW